MSQQNQTFTSPYNFVPISNQVIHPIWQNINHDQPEEQGYSGTIDITIKNISTLIIGDQQLDENSYQPFFKIQGNPAIPGSSLKGMIRSIIELATASYLQIQDNQFSQRDLTSAKNEYMTTIRPRMSGWLKYNPDLKKWTISPCEEKFKTIRHTSKTNNNEKSTATDVPEILEEELNRIKLHEIELAKERYETILEHYKKEKNLIGTCVELLPNQYLVVSNQLEGSSKCREFLFTPPKAEKIELEENTFQRFQQIMDKSQTEVGAEHWSYLKQFSQEGIPVFYLRDTSTKKITSFGLPSLYRLPYEKTLHNLLPQGQKNRNHKEKQDFCDLLFGDINNSNSLKNRKGRINIGLATTKEKTEFKTVEFVLAAPKPTFYPAYLKQNQGELKTYNKAIAISGAKTYLAHKNIKEYEAPKGADGKPNEKIKSKVEALTSKNTFNTKMRLHNLLPEEIGAIIWAINFGDKDNEQNIHLLGMGKPLGYGKIKLSITDMQLTANNPNNPIAEENYFLNKFYTYLGLHNLLTSDTLATLKAVHQDDCMPDKELVYLKLNPENNTDQFNDVIKNNRHLAPIKNGSFKKEFTNKATELQAGITKLKDQERQIELEQQEKLQREKQQQEKLQQEAEKQKKLSSRNPLETLIEDKLNNELNKPAIVELEENPNLWQNLSEEEQKKLAQKIKLADYYKNSNAKVRKKIRGRLNGLGKMMV